MNHSKESSPLNPQEDVISIENQFVTIGGLAGALTRVGVPTPLQERIMKETASVSSRDILRVIDDLEEFLDNLPEHERKEFERKAVTALKDELRINNQVMDDLRWEARRDVRKEVREAEAGEISEKVKERSKKKLGPLFDQYLAEVARRVFGFRIGELSSEERVLIEGIRRELDLPGEFDPDADRQHR